MFNYIVFLFCVFYLWSSIVAVPYHKVDYELGNPKSTNRYQVQTNNDRKIHSNTQLTGNSKSISISTSTEAETNTSYDEQYYDYNDDLLNKILNVTSDISAYDDTTENYMTSTSTAVAVMDYNSTWTTITWNYDEVYADALIYLIIFILVLSLIMFLWKIAHL